MNSQIPGIGACTPLSLGLDLLAHPATTDYSDHWKVKRPQVGVGSTRRVPGLLPRIIEIMLFLYFQI